ncbi:MAG: inositol monophosphatase [Euryarchaeota archaeon]|nr:inositol monophosphatase [Euryarchaeota archaeon]
MQDYIEILRNIANLASKTALRTIKKYGKDSAKKVRDGAYGHRSSLIDITVEDKIINYIENNNLPFNIFTEEAGHLKRGYTRTLIMDPVDGSNNAESGIPFFSVSLAITSGTLKDVEYALVKNIPTGTEYWAVRGRGAYKDGSPIKVRPGTGLFVLYMGRKAWEKAYRLAKKSRRVRDMGCASLEMVMVADGIADLFHYGFAEGGALRIVDLAASYLIVKEAGGLVLDDTLSPLEMELKFDDRKNVFALASEEMKKVIE